MIRFSVDMLIDVLILIAVGLIWNLTDVVMCRAKKHGVNFINALIIK